MNDETLLRSANLVQDWSIRAIRRTIAGQDDTPCITPASTMASFTHR
jgi:hypothetical protein